ncbi:hypothetical protein Ahy_B10g103647 [Arachis hypogaea]|uniref:Aspartic peptidase DDI1-type domain-containing protein n=1 Tax=Arachis hypogaea TaxID=3818 RepID=A0A444X3Z7_ARAHY|nr:hypothetical protein Ahy_B10g103647 [Arachis hypogaea]
MQLRSGKIFHVTDEMSNVNGGSTTSDSILVSVQQADVTSCSESAIGIEMGGFVPPIRFGSTNGGSNSQNPQQYSVYSRDYNLGSTSNAANSLAVYRQKVEESHHDLVNLLTQQMTTILNPMMADHESKFECLARDVERIARIVDYDYGERNNARGNIEGKLLNVHIPDLAHLAERVRQTELMKKEKENFDISKSDQIFDVLLKDKQLILPEGKTLLSVKNLKGKPFCKFHQATSHSTNSYVRFRDLIQEAIMEGRLKFDDGKKERKVDTDPFKADASFVEPCFGVNMVGMSYDFDVALDDFESQVRSVYPRARDGFLDFLVQQRIKDRDVSLCRRRSQAIRVQWIRNCQEFQKRDHLYRRNPQLGHRGPPRNQYPYYRGQARGYPRGRGGRRNSNQQKMPQMEVSKGVTPFVHSRIVFPSDGETCSKRIPSPMKMKKGKAIAESSGVNKNKEVDVDEEYFDEGDDDMVGTISIIPTEYLGEYEGDLNEDYDSEDEEVFSFIRIEDESGYFLRPTEKQMSHLHPLHITTTLSGIKVNKVLIDGGAAISLLPERMLIKVGKHPNDLVPTSCYLSSEGLSIKLRYPELGFEPTGWDCLS